MQSESHSPGAYCIIKTIHLMNFANPDTLTPVMKIRRPVAPERGKFSSVRARRNQNKTENPKAFRTGFVLRRDDVRTLATVDHKWFFI
jgi:hypothetical protein